MNDPSCVFCKIVAGEIPAQRVFEDDAVLAFLDIGPLAEGHLLVIPKPHYVTLDEMSPDAVAAVTGRLPGLARAVLRVTGASGYNILQNNGRVSGQAVFHVHFHIIPRRENDGLGYRWNASQYPEGRAEALHRQLVEAMASEGA